MRLWHRYKSRRWFGFLLVLALCFPLLGIDVFAENEDFYFSSLKKRLIKDGFDPNLINDLFNRKEVGFDTEGVSIFFTYRESRLNYDQFVRWNSIRKAKKYAQTHEADLANAEKAYGVDRHVITAIILVETKLGTYLGNRFILNTLSTMASLSDPSIRDAFWESIPKSKRFTREKFEEKAQSKSQWAYRELKAFLKYAEGEQFDPCCVTGSLAGAMGIAQFMPSNILSLGKDGNQDGRIDLFNHSDAIFSIANYLKHHGWQPGISQDKAYKVLLRYNYSKYYVNTILKIAERLRG